LITALKRRAPAACFRNDQHALPFIVGTTVCFPIVASSHVGLIERNRRWTCHLAMLENRHINACKVFFRRYRTQLKRSVSTICETYPCQVVTGFRLGVLAATIQMGSAGFSLRRIAIGRQDETTEFRTRPRPGLFHCIQHR
jgi:hypothetical protein